MNNHSFNPSLKNSINPLTSRLPQPGRPEIVSPKPKLPSSIKKLPPSVVKDIELKNHARRLASLSPIRIKVRLCISCSGQFESAGNRTCGCNTRNTGHIAGREIIY